MTLRTLAWISALLATNCTVLAQAGTATGPAQSPPEVASSQSSAAEDALLALLQGKPREAIRLYGTLIDEAPARKSQDFAAKVESDPKLQKLLRTLRQAVSLVGGKASAHNNRGVAYLMLGRDREALQDFDIAATMAADWPLPWINGSIAALNLGILDQAQRDSVEIARLGDESVRALTVRAEVALAQNRIESARTLIEKGSAIDPTFPSLLMVQSRLEQSLGRSRESERALAQALIGGSRVAGESRFESTSGDGYGFGGGIGAAHAKLNHQSAGAGGQVFRLRATTDRMQVEGRESAYQWRDLFEGVFSGSAGTFYGLYRQNAGGRPGAEVTIAGISPTPSTRFRSYNSLAMYANSFDLGREQELALLLKYRYARMLNRPNRNVSWDQSLQDEMLNGEFRWTKRYANQASLLGGASFSRLTRGGSRTNPFDPGESILGNGKTDLWTTYAAYELPIARNVKATVGAVAGNLARVVQVQPLASIQFGTKRPIRFGITPRLNDSNADLIPTAFLAETPLENRIDRHDRQPQDFNLDPVAKGRNTQFINTALAFETIRGANTSGTTTLFHRSLRDANLQGADPRAATVLRLTPVDGGEAFGIEQSVNVQMGKALALKVKGSYQLTQGGPNTPTLSADDFPAQVGKSLKRLPNFPMFQGLAELEWSPGKTVATLGLSFMGARPNAFSRDDGTGTLVTYVGNAPAAFGVRLFATHRFNVNSSITLGLYNLTKARFYEGYPAATTGFLGFEYRY